MLVLVNEFLLPYREGLKMHESAVEKAGGWFAESEENSVDANSRKDSACLAVLRPIRMQCKGCRNYGKQYHPTRCFLNARRLIEVTILF